MNIRSKQAFATVKASSLRKALSSRTITLEPLNLPPTLQFRKVKRKAPSALRWTLDLPDLLKNHCNIVFQSKNP